MTIFEASEQVTVHIGDHEETLSAPLTVEQMKAMAREHGLSRFVAKNAEGELFSQSDFPVSDGHVYIESYNEAKA